MKESDATEIHSVQGFEMTGTEILIHVVEHYSYHTGQITYFVKQLKNRQLDYYKGFDLNEKNQIK